MTCVARRLIPCQGLPSTGPVFNVLAIWFMSFRHFLVYVLGAYLPSMIGTSFHVQLLVLYSLDVSPDTYSKF